jgi:hypothetical protein
VLGDNIAPECTGLVLVVENLVVSLKEKEVRVSTIPLVKVCSTVEVSTTGYMHPRVPSCMLVITSERLAPFDTTAWLQTSVDWPAHRLSHN